MKSLSCRDLGSMDCEFKATGKTAKEIKEKMYTHAMRAHKDVLMKMSAKDKAAMDKLMDKLLAKQR